MDTITRNVDELTAADRTFLEHFLGKQLQRGQQVVVMAFVPKENEASVREAARKRLLLALDQAARHSAEQGISAEEADEAVAEAMEAIRHRPTK